MPYDTYYITETIAPTGYQIDLEEKELELEGTEMIFDFVNRKLESEIPEEPIEPSEPEDPEVPEEPIEPSKPEEPEIPEEPIEPSEPEDPEVPEEPIEPSEPEEPEIPEEPVEPSEPEEPGIPEEPIKPSEPQESTKPGTNGDSDDSKYDENIDIPSDSDDVVNNPSTYVKVYDNYMLICLIAAYILLILEMVNKKV